MCCKFSGFTIDPILSKMQDTKRPDYVDHRNSLVFWARPPPHVLDLAGKMQQSLEEIMPCKPHPLFHNQQPLFY